MILCDDCGRQFPSTDAVLKHECTKAPVPSNPAPVLTHGYRCPHCKSTRDFKSARALSVHVARSHPAASAEAAE